MRSLRTRFALLGAFLGPLLACAGLGGTTSWEGARGAVVASDAAAVDALLVAVGKGPADLAVVSPGDWLSSGESLVVAVEGERVTHLRLRRAGLGSMAAVAPMTALRHLDLTGNALGRIEGLDRAGALETLTLNENAVGALDGLQGCAALKSLYLDDNRIGSLAGLPALPALQNLGVAGNRLTSLDGLAGRTALLGLYVARNQLSHLDGVHDLPELYTLAAGSNAIVSVEGLKNLPKLTHLSLDANQLRDATALTGLPALRWVDLTRNPMSARPALGSGVEVKVDGSVVVGNAPVATAAVTVATGGPVKAPPAIPGPTGVDGPSKLEEVQVAALPEGGGSIDVDREGSRQRGTHAFNREGTVTSLRGVAFLRLNEKRSFGSRAETRFVMDITTGSAPINVYSSAGEGFWRRTVPANTIARVEGSMVPGAGRDTYGVYIESPGVETSGVHFRARAP